MRVNGSPCKPKYRALILARANQEFIDFRDPNIYQCRQRFYRRLSEISHWETTPILQVAIYKTRSIFKIFA